MHDRHSGLEPESNGGDVDSRLRGKHHGIAKPHKGMKMAAFCGKR